MMYVAGLIHFEDRNVIQIYTQECRGLPSVSHYWENELCWKMFSTEECHVTFVWCQANEELYSKWRGVKQDWKFL